MEATGEMNPARIEPVVRSKEKMMRRDMDIPKSKTCERKLNTKIIYLKNFTE
jgi:hypothetical protein